MYSLSLLINFWIFQSRRTRSNNRINHSKCKKQSNWKLFETNFETPTDRIQLAVIVTKSARGDKIKIQKWNKKLQHDFRACCAELATRQGVILSETGTWGNWFVSDLVEEEIRSSAVVVCSCCQGRGHIMCGGGEMWWRTMWGNVLNEAADNIPCATQLERNKDIVIQRY